jgi:hypothetical protein
MTISSEIQEILRSLAQNFERLQCIKQVAEIVSNGRIHIEYILMTGSGIAAILR